MGLCLAGRKDSKRNYPETVDDAGNDMGSPEAMWALILKENQEKEWYAKAADYWERVEATYQGVLGGHSEVSPADIEESWQFLQALFKEKGVGKTRSLDCGAGVGRVTKDLLQNQFENVDIMEQNPKYVEEAKKILKDSKSARHFYTKGMQEFIFEEKYDCIWIQWAISHLTDPDMIRFLEKASESLNPKGVIVLKENILPNGRYLFHRDDVSVTRSEETFKRLFELAGMKIVSQVYQKEFPNYLLPVCMFAIRKGENEIGNK